MSVAFQEQFRRRKNSYRRAAKLTHKAAMKTGCPSMHYLWQQDIRRALHYRDLEYLARQWGI